MDLIIDGIRLHCTCRACPEQYDAYDENDQQVGYLRLRHGYFTVDFPDYGGELLLECETIGDGMFDCSERETMLRLAVSLIKKKLGASPDAH